MKNSRDGIGVWLYGALGAYLALELLPFLVAALASQKTVGELSGPYLACAMPAVIFLPLVWWLRRREKQGASPKVLARGWGVSGALWCAVTIIAVIYSGAKFQLINSKDSVDDLVFSALLGVPIVYFTLYYAVLMRISTRSTTKFGATHNEE